MSETKKTIRLGELRAATVPLDVDYAGATVTIEYRPYALDGTFEDAFLAAIEAAENQFDVYNAYRRMLPEILGGWNVVDDADAPLPLDLRAMPGKVLVAWWKAIQEHISPN